MDSDRHSSSQWHNVYHQYLCGHLKIIYYRLLKKNWRPIGFFNLTTIRNILRSEQSIFWWPKKSMLWHGRLNLLNWIQWNICGTMSIKRSKRKNHQIWIYNIVDESWKNIPVSRCLSLIASMPRRCAEFIRNNGWITKY